MPVYGARHPARASHANNRGQHCARNTSSTSDGGGFTPPTAGHPVRRFRRANLAEAYLSVIGMAVFAGWVYPSVVNCHYQTPALGLQASQRPKRLAADWQDARGEVDTVPWTGAAGRTEQLLVCKIGRLESSGEGKREIGCSAGTHQKTRDSRACKGSCCRERTRLEAISHVDASPWSLGSGIRSRLTSHSALPTMPGRPDEMRLTASECSRLRVDYDDEMLCFEIDKAQTHYV